MMVMRSSPLPVIMIQNNDEPPCTPLAIVKRVSLGSLAGQGFDKKRRGAFAPPKARRLHPLDILLSVVVHLLAALQLRHIRL